MVIEGINMFEKIQHDITHGSLLYCLPLLQGAS
jgi:hypothetical protein